MSLAAWTPGLGSPRVHLRRTDSTNERARALALAGAPHGTLVTAAEQSAGRGRQGRTWSAPPGSSLLMSLLLRSPPTLLPLIAAVAACDVLATRLQAARPPLIKWPNDIVIEGPRGAEKLAGILVEGRPQEGWAVLGIGINVAVDVGALPEDVGPGAATLGAHASEVEPLLSDLVKALDRRLAEPAAEMLGAWRARDALEGRMIRWGAQGQSAGQSAGQSEGIAQGIDGAGRLVVSLAGGGQRTLEAGEVHLVPSAERSS